jgi:THO complex subunit 2
LREDADGYSRLIETLVDLPADAETRVMSLIGIYDLDPNRVLALLLDTWELSPYNLHYLSLVQKFSSQTVTQLLGFKCQNVKEPSQALGFIAGLLIAKGSVDLNGLWSHLSPASFSEHYSEQYKAACSFRSSVDIILLSGMEGQLRRYIYSR